MDGGRFDPETPECRRAQHDPRCQRRRPIPFARLGRATLARCDEKIRFCSLPLYTVNSSISVKNGGNLCSSLLRDFALNEKFLIGEMI